ncbi:MAG: class I SAM-dependent RNA methyltransferase, partial [Actinobacteria bacterium]|nr:class I SAM-dependent RNA methyltransferase [Actinomycetota bacterium]
MLELEITGVAHGGWCVARDASGRVVFVRHALPGERVLARVTGETARFARADAVEIIEPSPDRVAPPCPHARPGGCGGCDWQHASLPAQRRLKAAVIGEQLRRIAGLEREITVEPLPGDSGGLGWRTRVRFSVAPDGTAGLLRHRSHEVAEVTDCLIAHPLIRELAVTRQRWHGARWVEAVAAPGSGERALLVSPDAARCEPAATALASSVISVRGRREAPVRGRGYLRQAAAGRTWRVAASGFWQGHPGAAGVLTEAVLAALRPRPGDVALDLYSGAGLFAGALAGAVGPDGTVIAVESDPAAVRDARHNLRATPWARVHRGEAARVLAAGPGRDWPAPRLAVLDPPRAGAGREVVAQLAALAGLERIAYVSCDPATLARDIALFTAARWQLAELRGFDAFPMTHHVECLAVLARGGTAPSRGIP